MRVFVCLQVPTWVRLDFVKMHSRLLHELAAVTDEYFLSVVIEQKY